ncbi:hypothetical protein [Natrarchaeobaculum sulfurireducens]|uniref:hypothetical protein n=1 Tax=Natrarchaeobaculum sulfurireducens TaxID=2044521 RepID=UPI00105AB089|nr:hypothetical protein [Natrarchaeobaculum sulfurireducens]
MDVNDIVSVLAVDIDCLDEVDIETLETPLEQPSLVLRPVIGKSYVEFVLEFVHPVRSVFGPLWTSPRVGPTSAIWVRTTGHTVPFDDVAEVAMAPYYTGLN